MSHVLNRAIVALTALAVAAGGALMGAPAQAAPTTVTQVRQTDLVPATVSVNGGGKLEFLAQGVHLKMPNPAVDFARGRFTIGSRWPRCTRSTTPGTAPTTRRASSYGLDIDGDGNADGELIGESFYGGHDLWLNQDVQDVPGSTPAGQLVRQPGAVRQRRQAPRRVDTCTPPRAPATRTTAPRRLGTSLGRRRQGRRARLRWLRGRRRSQTASSRQITYGPEPVRLHQPGQDQGERHGRGQARKVKKAQKIRFSGKVTPTGPGAKVSLEEKRSGSGSASRAKTLAASGEFRFGAKPDRLGKLRFRVSVSETNSTVAAKSNTVKVLVTRK